MADDLISRQHAIDAVEKSMSENPHENAIHRGMHDHEHRHFLTILMGLPSVQPEIIRCKDCKHSRFFDPCFYCYEMGGEVIVPENGFCFKAERRKVTE